MFADLVCDTTENKVRQWYCYTCLAIGRGGYFGRVTKDVHVDIQADVRGQTVEASVRPSTSWQKSHEDADIHDPKVWTPMTSSEFKQYDCTTDGPYNGDERWRYRIIPLSRAPFASLCFCLF